MKDTWHAVVYVEVTQNINEPDENRYCAHTKIIAISEDHRTIAELADALNAEHRHKFKTKTAQEAAEHYADFVGQKFFVTDTFKLDGDAIESYERDGRIIGRPGFKLRLT